MSTMRPRTLLLSLFFMSFVPALSQTKKDIIAAQSTTIDSLLSVCEQQHTLLLKAQTRIEDLTELSSTLKSKLDRNKVVNDTLQSHLERQKKLTYNAQVARPFLTRPTKDPTNGVLDRREAYIHFSSAEHLDHVILETKGVDLLTGITTLKILGSEYDLLLELAIETTDVSELDLDPALQHCIVSNRLDEILSPHTLVPIALDRNKQWRILSLDRVSIVPHVQCGVLVSERIADPTPRLYVFDRSARKVIRINDPLR